MSSYVSVVPHALSSLLNETIPDPRRPGLWFVAQTKPRQEERAEANLLTLGVETFLPRTKEPQTRRSRGSRIAPFFPGYLFVKCNVLAMLHKITYTRGIHKMLGNSGGPQPIDLEVIETIRQRIGDDGLVRIQPTFSEGDAVRVTCGPLADLNGIFHGYRRPADRAVVLLRTLTGCFRVVVDCDSLETY